MKTEKKLIVVLGVHRSGTSTVARSLVTMGVELGDNLMPGVERDNQKGFWEDLDLYALNEEILDAIGLTWFSASVIKSSDLDILRKKGFYEKAEELLKKKTDKAKVFGIKDPRISKLLLFWKEIFERVGLEVGYVLAIRNPMSVARSLYERDGITLSMGYYLFLTHIIPSVRLTENCTRTIIDYDYLLDRPEKELLRVSESIGLSLCKQKSSEFISNFVDFDLRHTRFGSDDLNLDRGCLQLIKDIYQSLLAITYGHHADSNSLRTKAISWYSDFEALESLFQDQNARTDELERTIADHGIELAYRLKVIEETDQARKDQHARADQLERIVADQAIELAYRLKVIEETDQARKDQHARADKLESILINQVGNIRDSLAQDASQAIKGA